MATFFEELWGSIFTAGPTPTLLFATNMSFGALQLVLFALLLATYSIHFVVLSILCAGLWWAINWFAQELRASQVLEEQEKKRAERAAAAEDSETEVETMDIKSGPSAAASSKAVEVLEPAGELTHRAESSSENKSGVSTEDEWEKISEAENEKDK